MFDKLFKKKRGKAGFTLIELLVTITIVGIISITTFAIVMSSMNTFKRQQDIIDGNDIKELISMTVKERLRTRSNIFLLNENLAPSFYEEGQPDVIQGTDGFGDYLLDPRLVEHHMIYAKEGRLYTVTGNIEGKYYTDRKYDITAERFAYAKDTTNVSMPNTDPTPGAPAELKLNGEFGCHEFMAESLYDRYFVDVKFRPIYTNVQGRFRDLQLKIFIYDDISMTTEHLVTSGTETFHMLNIENKQTEIKFQNDAYDDVAHPENKKKPYMEGYSFCYFA